MPQIVQPEPRKTGTLGNRAPGTVEIGAGLLALSPGALACDDVSAKTFKLREYSERRRVEDDRLRASLAVREQEQTAFQIDVLPFELQDFAESSAG
jgi:hypothetical protein